MLFLIIGVVYERRHTREISEYGGLAHVMPKFAVIFAIAMLSSAGLPLLNGFIGEFTILQGAFEASRVWAAFAVTGVILGAAYLLWLYQRTMLGQVTNGKNLGLPDVSFREIAVFAPLIAWAFWIGIYPKPYFDILRKPVTEIVERVRPGYFAQAGVPVPLAGIGDPYWRQNPTSLAYPRALWIEIARAPIPMPSLGKKAPPPVPAPPPAGGAR
jgi:NADH-quinone oxidoreductase subunit M